MATLPIIYLIFLIFSVTKCSPNQNYRHHHLFVGHDDPTLKDHYMYNRSIGIYHKLGGGGGVDDDDHHKVTVQFCYGKPNGLYSLGMCKNFYATCDADQGLTITLCPTGQVYRQEERTCVDEASEPRCIDDIDYVIDHSNLCSGADDQSSDQQNGRRRELVALEPCSRTYGVCNDGKIYFTKCQLETHAYSDLYGACIEKREHSHCPKNPDDDQPIDRLMIFQPISTMCGGSDQQQPSEADYLLYFGPCNRRYLLCDRFGLDGFVGECPENSVADQTYGKCVPKSKSEFCNGQKNREDSPRLVQQQMNIVLKNTKFCAGKSNGLYFDPYSRECRREAVFCFENEGTFHICPIGQGIDSKTGRCSIKDSCWMTSDQSGEIGIWKSSSSFLTSFASELSLCQRTESDGIHVFGFCLNFYGRCHLGKFEIRSCGGAEEEEDEEEIFDVELSRCVRRSLTSSISCNSNTAITAETDDKEEIIDYEKSPPVIVVVNRCSSTDIDVVSKLVSTGGGCESTFLACANGWEVMFRCEKRADVFHEPSQTCVSKIDHPECAEYRLTTTITTTTTIASTTTAGKEATTLTCEGDGGFHIHPDDCTKFYRCAHGRLVEMSCPTATAFDPAINVCNHKHLVDRCKMDEKKKTKNAGGLF